MWLVQVGYNTESKLWLKHVMQPQTKCRTGSINTSRYYFDLCAVHFASNLSLCLRVMTIMLQETYVHKKMIDGQSDNYLGGYVRKWFEISVVWTFSNDSGYQKVGTVVRTKSPGTESDKWWCQWNYSWTTTAEIKHMKSKLDRALRSWSFKLST